mgnify:CR=1 FL=1
MENKQLVRETKYNKSELTQTLSLSNQRTWKWRVLVFAQLHPWSEGERGGAFLFHLILPILNVKQNVSVDKFESGAEVELQEKIEIKKSLRAENCNQLDS